MKHIEIRETCTKLRVAVTDTKLTRSITRLGTNTDEGETGSSSTISTRISITWAPLDTPGHHRPQQASVPTDLDKNRFDKNCGV